MVLSARWTYYTEGSYLGDSIQYIYNKENLEITQENSIRTFTSGIRDTFEQYSKSNIKVFVLLQVPMQETNPDQIFYSSLVDNKLSESKILENSITLKKHNDFQKRTNNIIIQEANRFNNIIVIDPTPEMCGSANCPVGNESVSHYFDDDHLSISGSFRLKDLIEENVLD